MVTNETTVSQLVELGVFTQTQIDTAVKRLDRSKNKALIDEQRNEIKSQVLGIMTEVPEFEYKNGDILPFFGFDGPQKDSFMEELRVDKHKEISRALTELAAEGKITRFTGSNSTQTTYMIVADEPEINQELLEDDGESELQAWLLEEEETTTYIQVTENTTPLEEEGEDPLENEAEELFNALRRHS
tara:strand:+ start:7239 stop:7799 length:561 start_codon:yes stop_codon:yes gene_type:complete